MIYIKNAFRLVLTAVITVLLCVGLLAATARIPKTAMMAKWVESSDYFYEHELFPRFMGDVLRTMQDNFSDCNIWNIMLYTDEEKPLTSSLEARFFQPEGYGMQVGYKIAIDTYQGGTLLEQLNEMTEANQITTTEANANQITTTEANADQITTTEANANQTPLGENSADGMGNLPIANQEYARYWHGTMAYLRPLSLFLNVVQIRILMGIIITLCFAICSIILWKRQMRVESVLLWISLFFLQGWMLFTSLEYSTAFVWTAIFSLWAVANNQKKSLDSWSNFFLVAGIVTAFVDFLTTETLTLTMPLLLILLGYRKTGELETLRNTCKSKLSFLWNILGKYVIVWGIGYAGMYVLKWIMVYLIMGSSVFSSSMDEGLLRVGGTVYLGNSNLFDEATLLQQYQGAVWHNLAMLFPFGSDISYYKTMLCFGGVCALLFALVYLFRGKIDWSYFGLLSMIGAIPILRFLLLSNHAYIHFFFTYRAMLPTVMICLLFVWENAIANLIHKNTKKNKKRN